MGKVSAGEEGGGSGRAWGESTRERVRGRRLAGQLVTAMMVATS